jgi:hypothetical protein
MANLREGLGSVLVAVAARIALVAFVCLLGIDTHPAVASDPPRRIYFLESLAPTQPAAVATLEAFRGRLSEKSSEQFEILIDFLELGRFPGPEHEEQTARYLAEKYAQAPPTLLITLGRGAATFLSKYRDRLGSEVPAILASLPARSPEAANLPRKSLAVVAEYNSARTLALAQALQPGARHLAIVAGSSAYDREWFDEAVREIEPSLSRYDTNYIVGLPYSETLNRVARLPHDSIVMMLFYFADGEGRVRAPVEVAADVARFLRFLFTRLVVLFLVGESSAVIWIALKVTGSSLRTSPSKSWPAKISILFLGTRNQNMLIAWMGGNWRNGAWPNPGSPRIHSFCSRSRP